LPHNAEVALQKLEAYRPIPAARRGADDDEMQAIYQAISRNDKPLLNLHYVPAALCYARRRRGKVPFATAAWMQTSGHAWPWREQTGARSGFIRVRPGAKPAVVVFAHREFGTTAPPASTSGCRATSSNNRWPSTKCCAAPCRFPFGPCGTQRPKGKDVPPTLRPAAKLENYFILFEVEQWEAYPRDPFLLKQVVGPIYMIIAEWELTELEAELLAAIQGE
jgi:hypothetical protein